MKTIQTSAIIEGIRAKKDRSLGLTVATPELNSQEKALFMDLQGVNVTLLITPSDEPKPEEYKIDTDINQKSQSERMRSVMFILWKQEIEGTKNEISFQEYYRQQTDKIIEYLKGKIE